MTTQTEPIRGKVASILNSRQVAINRGEVDGVRRGMRFNILSEAVDVKDPDSGVLLGTIQQAKICVEVKSVYPNMAVAATFKKHRVNVGGSGIGLGIFTPPKWEEHYETLYIEDASLEEIDESDSYVLIGDAVVQVLESDPPNAPAHSPRKAEQSTP